MRAEPTYLDVKLVLRQEGPHLEERLERERRARAELKRGANEREQLHSAQETSAAGATTELPLLGKWGKDAEAESQLPLYGYGEGFER